VRVLASAPRTARPKNFSRLRLCWLAAIFFHRGLRIPEPCAKAPALWTPQRILIDRSSKPTDPFPMATPKRDCCNPWAKRTALDHSERSLSRERFRGHNFTICNNHRQKINQNPDLMKMAYPHFSRPNNC
jgi:hypothetical protein